MAIQRSCGKNLYVLIFIDDTFHNGGQVALQMGARSEEVGDDDDPLHTARDEQIGSLLQAGTAEFQEGGFDDGEVAGAREVGCRRADSLVGRLDSGAVSEDNYSGGHALLM